MAARWDGRGRPESLLLRGDDLDAAKAWMAARKAEAPEITVAQRAFVKASEEAETTRLGKERAQVEELVGERTRREGAERRGSVMVTQIAKEVEVQVALKRERDDAVDEVANLKATVGELTQAREEAEVKQAEAQQALKLERDSALDQVAALKATVGQLTQARADAEVREAQVHQDLKQGRDKALDEVAVLKAAVEELKQQRDRAIDEAVALKARVDELSRAHSEIEARAVDLSH